jgi:glyoxylase-like metal-dependent hydrolase (beta-lactamase superfamily II)
LTYQTASLTVLERGWLSSNSVVFPVGERAAVVDTGYSSHSAQTSLLIQSVLGRRPLDIIANTHLHSDHCGGNATLQSSFPSSQTYIPPGHASHVTIWDAEALSYTPTGQFCPAFQFHGLLTPGTTIQLGSQFWEIHAAPGHDAESVILFEPDTRTLISADALWENGFGVLFPELEGVRAFADVGATLDLIERLAPKTVIPGHGKVFSHLSLALKHARSRLDQFVKHPVQHAKYAAKVLLKYKLLELQACDRAQLFAWFQSTRYFGVLRKEYFDSASELEWFNELLLSLVKSQAAIVDAEMIRNLD